MKNSTESGSKVVDDAFVDGEFVDAEWDEFLTVSVVGEGAAEVVEGGVEVFVIDEAGGVGGAEVGDGALHRVGDGTGFFVEGFGDTEAFYFFLGEEDVAVCAAET